MPTALVVLADPAGGDDAAGRVFNALAAARDFHRHGDDVRVVFQGAATRWPALLADPAHPFHALWSSVEPLVAGVCAACAHVFGARESAEAAGLQLLGGNPIEGVGELTSLAQYVTDGYTLVTF